MSHRTRIVVSAGASAPPPPGPTAAFSADDTTVDTNTVVTFTDESTGTPTSWAWDFGDGNTSTDQNPTHTYAEPGTWTVTLTATNAGGSDQEEKTSYIVVTSFLAGFTGYDSEWSAERAYTDTGMLSDATADGDSVAALEDLGSNARNMTQGTAGNRPTYVTVGGKPAVKFLASASKTLATAAFFDATWNTSFSAYLVFEYHGRAGPKVMIGGNGTNLFVAGELDGGTAMRIDCFTSGNGTRYHNFTNKNRCVVAMIYNGATKDLTFRGYTGVSDEVRSNAMTANLGLSGGITLGDLSQGGGFACNFFFHHLILYKAGHSEGERDSILDFLRTKWLTEPAAGAYATGNGTRRIVADGDSLTVGQGLSAGQEWPALLLADLGGSYSMSNLAVGGQMQSEMNADAETQVDVLFSASNTDNIYVNWAGTNDAYYGIPADTTYRRIREGCLRRRAKGFKVIVVNTIDRNDGGGVANFDTRRAALNTLLTDNWDEFADAYVDLWADSRFQDATNTTYFQGDLVHITAAAQVIVKDAIKTAVQAIEA
jgi:PKD repeat protein